MVSILLPTFNRGGRLPVCVNSVLGQSYRNWELLICDDDSTDDTDEIGSRLVRCDSRIRYIKNQAHKGLPRTRNVGISLSNGSLIQFIEDDMVLESDCIEKLIGVFIQFNTEMKFGAVAPSLQDEYQGQGSPSRSILDYGWRMSNRKMKEPCTFNPLTGIVHYHFSRNYSGVREVPSVHACSLYSKQALEEIGGYDEKTYLGNYLYEETDLNLRLRKSGYRLLFQPAAIMHHRLESASGGCRVDAKRYAYYFVLNHIKYLGKNFGWHCVWMIPFFLISVGATGMRAVLAYSFSGKPTN